MRASPWAATIAGSAALALALDFTAPATTAAAATAAATSARPALAVVRPEEPYHIPQVPFSRIEDLGRPALRVYTDRDGLPQNAVTTVVRDAAGLLWIGTKDGAARFDGRNFSPLSLTPHVTSNWVQAIRPARDGSLWFGTIGGGGARLSEGRFTRLDERLGLPDDEVTAIAETGEPGMPGTIWLATRKGLVSFRHGAFSVEEPVPGTAGANVTAMVALREPDGGEALWVGLRNVGAARLKAGRWTLFGEESGLPSSPLYFSDFVVTSAFGPPELVVASSGRLLRFDGERFHCLTLEGGPPPGINQLLDTVGPDGSHALWVSTQNGIFRFQRDRWRPFYRRHGLPHMNVWCLLATSSSAGTTTVWGGTAGGGLVRLELGRFSAFDAATGLPDSSVYAFLETRGTGGDPADPDFYVGTNVGGLAHYRRGRVTVYHRDTGVLLIGSSISALAETSGPPPGGRGSSGGRTLWVGTASGGLFARNGESWFWLNAKGLNLLVNGDWVPVDPSQTLQASRVFALVPSPTGEEAPGEPPRGLWVGMDGQGLARIVDGRLSPPQAAASLPDERVRAVLETRGPGAERTLWVATERGLARLSGGARAVFGVGSGLAVDVVTSLTEVTRDGRRELWIGTLGGGAALLDLNRPDATPVPAGPPLFPELPNRTVYQIQKDSRGRIYLFTNKGVARWTPRAPTPDEPRVMSDYVFTTEDGLPSNECNTGASYVDSYGRVWAGTIAGAAVLDPKAEVEDALPRPLLLESARLVRRDRALAVGASLAHDESHVLFEYALLHAFRSEETRYRTRLEGLDAAFSPWTADTKKEYTSLPRGRYVFRVEARDVRGVVSRGIEVPFSVRPAPWLTLWAFAGYAFLLAGLVYGVFRIRLAAVRKRNLWLEERIEERTAALAESERAALQANRAKSVFLSNMSHELRTPLNAVLGFTQLLERDASATPRQKESLSVIRRAGEHLLGLINDVLSISKIEAGHASVAPAPFDLRSLLSGVEDLLRIRAEAKGLDLVFEVSPDLPAGVRGDEGKIRQILLNLLGNALKFTERGSVTLRAAWDEGRARFEVEDTGPGIAPGELPGLFEPFVQAASGRQAKEGTGLGLALSRQLARLMNGDITVSSTVGRGTTFLVTLDLTASSEAERPDRGDRRRVVRLSPGQAPVRVLVVDDVRDNRLLLNGLLSSVGFEVAEAESGERGVEVWRRLRPRLIFMDKRMPGIDGLEATRRIREEERRLGGERTRIVALSASAFDHERGAILEAGCDDFVAKPFHEGLIFAKLGEHLGVRYDYDEPGAETPREPEPSALDRSRLARVPEALRQALERAARAGDFDAAEAVARRIGEEDGALGESLAAAVGAFEFDAVLRALEATAGPAAPSTR